MDGEEEQKRRILPTFRREGDNETETTVRTVMETGKSVWFKKWGWPIILTFFTIILLRWAWIEGVLSYFIQSIIITIICGYYPMARRFKHVQGNAYTLFPDAYLEDEAGNLLENPNRTIKGWIIPHKIAGQFNYHYNFNCYHSALHGRIYMCSELDIKRKYIRGTWRAELDAASYENSSLAFYKCKVMLKRMIQSGHYLADLIDIDVLNGIHEKYTIINEVIKGSPLHLIDEVAKELNRLKYTENREFLDKRLSEIRQSEIEEREKGMVLDDE